MSRKLAVNSLLLFTGNVVAAGFSFVVSVYLARYLGPGEYGRYSVVFAYLSMFHVVAGAGIDTILIRELSIDPERKNLLASQAILLRSLLSLSAVGISWLILPFFGYDDDVRTWVHIASLGLLFGVRSTVAALFQASLRVADYALPELALAILFNLALLLAIIGRVPVAFLIVLQTANLGFLLVAFFVVARVRMELRLRLVIDLPICRRLLSEALPIFFTGFFISVMFRIDQLLVYRILGSTSLGMYSAVVRIAEALNMIPVIYVTVVYPIMCSAHASSREYFLKVYRRSMKYMAAIIVPLAFGATLLSGNIVQTIYGAGFVPASRAFALLMWAEVFVFLGTIFGNAFNAMGMQRYIMIYSGVGTAVNIILNLLLIPRYGITGAAIATLNSYGGLCFLIQLSDTTIRPYAMEYFRASAVPMVASCVMTGFLYVLGGKWNLWFQIIAGGAIYFLILYLLHFLDTEDKEYLRQVFLERG